MTVGAIIDISFSVACAAIGAASRIEKVSGDNQTGAVGGALALPLVVRVTDAFGNPVSGAAVDWSVTGGGSASPTATLTDASGQASVIRTLGVTAGQQTTIGTAAGLSGSPVTFTHTATAGSASRVEKISGDNQSANPGQQLAQPLVVQVLDGANNPIPNRALTWTIGEGGGSVAPVNTTTDAQGNASTRWTLGPSVGPNTVNAVVSGLAPATFSATATAGAPSASNSSVSASPTTIAAGASSTITVTVRDANTNPVAGVSVTVSSSNSTDNISPATASSGANGVVTFTFSSSVGETKTITATAGGVTISDQATITVQKASSTAEITSDDPEPSTVGQAVTVEFTVRGSVGGTPTGDVTVTVSGGPETCTGTLNGGAGSCSLTLTVLGMGSNNRRTLTASYGGDARFLGDSDNENHDMTVVPPANTPPNAAFTPSCSGLTCGFLDQSTDDKGVGAWSWTFDDPASGLNNTSDARHPSHPFSAPGTYSVSLTVRDSEGATDTETQSVTVTAPPANNPPTANFSMTCDAVSCTFTNSSSDPDNDIISWTWDFGDGSGFEGRDPPPHPYVPGGPYTVTLRVVDDDLAEDTETQQTPVFP